MDLWMISRMTWLMRLSIAPTSIRVQQLCTLPDSSLDSLRMSLTSRLRLSLVTHVPTRVTKSFRLPTLNSPSATSRQPTIRWCSSCIGPAMICRTAHKISGRGSAKSTTRGTGSSLIQPPRTCWLLTWARTVIWWSLYTRIWWLSMALTMVLKTSSTLVSSMEESSTSLLSQTILASSQMRLSERGYNWEKLSSINCNTVRLLKQRYHDLHPPLRTIVALQRL